MMSVSDLEYLDCVEDFFLKHFEKLNEIDEKSIRNTIFIAICNNFQRNKKLRDMILKKIQERVDLPIEDPNSFRRSDFKD